MFISPEPRREQPSTYFVQDRANREELNRLHIQDRMLTEGMGGVLPEQPDPTAFPSVLDIGCGVGAWLIELAKTTPTCKMLVGVDVSLKFIEYARSQAQAAQVSDRVEFHIMDALRMLDFPTGYFDLVNHRAGMSWLRTWDWSKLLKEYQRVCRPGGVVRITEPEVISVSSSPAFSRLLELFLQAFYQSGLFFTPTRDGLTSELARLLRQHGMQAVQTRSSTIEYRAGTSEWQHFVEDTRLTFRTLLPFLQKWTRVPDDYKTLCQQALREMHQPDFVATEEMLTVWGNPSHVSDQPGNDYPS